MLSFRERLLYDNVLCQVTIEKKLQRALHTFDISVAIISPWKLIIKRICWPAQWLCQRVNFTFPSLIVQYISPYKYTTLYTCLSCICLCFASTQVKGSIVNYPSFLLFKGTVSLELSWVKSEIN
jgi:hypothetical protein